MSSAYTDITFTNAPQGGITAAKLNLLVDNLSSAIAAAGSGGGSGGTGMIWGETPGGVINGSNKTFTSAYSYLSNQCAVFLNGVRQRRVNDYTETGSNSFSFVVAPLSGDILSIDYVKA